MSTIGQAGGMNRAAVIEQLKAKHETISKLLVIFESGEADKFVAHLYQARKQYRLVCERPSKGNKAIEREVISSYQIAQSWALRATFASGAPAADSLSDPSEARMEFHRAASCSLYVSRVALAKQLQARHYP
jgi:hypothetical protein